MNLKDELLALRNRTQLLAANLHLVVSSLDDTLILVDSIYHADKQPDAHMKPVRNAKVVADTVQVAIAATLTTPLAKPANLSIPSSSSSSWMPAVLRSLATMAPPITPPNIRGAQAQS